jgi:chromate reductase, NAD(P)H dehydrogenase (quinone)
MAKVKVAVIVGSNRRDSINRKLAQALAGLGEDRLAFHFVSIEELPLYNQDLEGELPQSVVRFKSEIAAADAVLFVTPEHNRSIPAVLKNAIDWGARPYGQNSWSGKPAAITGTSPGALGTAVAQLHLRQVLGTLGALSWAGKPTSLLSRVCWTRTERSPMRRRADFSRLSSISSRRWSPGRRLLERQPPRRAVHRRNCAVNTTNTLQEVKSSCPFGR